MWDYSGEGERAGGREEVKGTTRTCPERIEDAEEDVRIGKKECDISNELNHVTFLKSFDSPVQWPLRWETRYVKKEITESSN